MRRNHSSSSRQSGIAMVAMVLAILAVAALGVGMASMFSETGVRQAASGLGPEAQYMAESGIRYVQGQIALDVENRVNLNGRTITVGSGAGAFNLITAPLDLRVIGNYAPGATVITLTDLNSIMPGGLALANTGIRFYNSNGQSLKAEGRITSTSPRGNVVTLEAPGIQAALTDGDKVVSKVEPYGIWSVGSAGAGGEATSRVLGMAMNTKTEDWPPYIIIQGPGGTLPDENKNIFGIGNADYGGIVHKGVKLGPSNEVLDPRANNGEIRLNIVARHGGDGWKASIQVEGGTANQGAGNVTGQTWYQNDPDFWVPFIFTYNTADGNTADGTYDVRWRLFNSYNPVQGQTPDLNNPVVDMTHDFGPPNSGMERVLGNWYMIAQAPQKQDFTGTITIREIKKNNVLLPQSFISISSSGDQYTSLVAQNRKAETFIKISGEINLHWTGNPAQDYGMNLYFYVHDIIQ